VPATSLRSPLTRASAIASGLQVIMVVAGHLIPEIGDQFPVIGTALAAVGGLLFGIWDRDATGGKALMGGALTGALSAFVGILTAFALGDTTLSVLVFGPASGAIAGAVGGLLGHLLVGRTTR